MNVWKLAMALMAFCLFSAAGSALAAQGDVGVAPEKKVEKKKKKSGPSDSIRLSEQAKRNIGLEVGDVEIRKSYARNLNVPSMVVGLPGRTRIQIASPMTGIVTKIAIVRG